MSSTNSTFTLIEKIKSGDENALQELFMQLKDSVFNTALHYVRNRHDAEEILQDVFVEVFHSIGTFKGDSSLKTWVIRIAINKSIDALKYKSRKKRFAFITSIISRETGEVKVHIPEYNHPGIMLENWEKAQFLFKAVDSLPEKQREVFILLKLENLSQREAAEVLQIGEKAVESLYQRAKQNLRKALADIYKEL